MKKYKKHMRKLMTFVLLLALFATMGQPVNSYAADELDGIADEENKNVESLSGEITENSELSEDSGENEEQQQVKLGETEQDSEIDVEVNFYALDENGFYTCISTQKQKMRENQSLKEGGIQFPEMGSAYSGVTQIGWMNDYGEEITEDSVSIRAGNIYAKYNKGILPVQYEYPDKNGYWITEDRPVIFEHGDTYGTAIEKAREYKPADFMGDSAFGWGIPSMLTPDASGTANDVITGIAEVRLSAKFSGMVSIHVLGKYYDQRGSYGCHGDRFLKMKEGSTYGDALKILSQNLPEMYPGLRFKEWDFPSSYTNEVLPEKAAFKMKAVYENCIVRYLINPTEEDMYSVLDGDGEVATIFCQVAEKGEILNALTSFKGFGNVTWWEGRNYGLGIPPASFVVNEDMLFCGDAEVVPVDSSKPSDTSKPSDDTDKKDDSKLPVGAVNEIVETIKNASPGEAFRIAMGTKTIISKEILEAAKGKNITLVLEMDGYTWTIKGMDIQAEEPQDIELRVIKNTNNIPASTVQALAGALPSMQITLVYNGNFGFKATLTLGVGSQYAGKYGNLFHHNNDKKMAFIDTGLIDASGNVNLTFSHASDYLLVISDRMMSQADVPIDLMLAGSQGQGQNGIQNAASGNQSVKTGDYDTILPWIMLSVSALGIMMFLKKKKNA